MWIGLRKFISKYFYFFLEYTKFEIKGLRINGEITLSKKRKKVFMLIYLGQIKEII
jgi:hypothetical protein